MIFSNFFYHLAVSRAKDKTHDSTPKEIKSKKSREGNKSDSIAVFTVRTSKICIANSRVGDMITAPSPSVMDQPSLYNFSRTGITKARVFPDPVFAAPNTSLLREAGAGGYALRPK
jgi:hypothetical protein